MRRNLAGVLILVLFLVFGMGISAEDKDFITEQEFIAALVTQLNLDLPEKAEEPFASMDKDFGRFVQKAYMVELIPCVEDFKPENKITREKALFFLSKVFEDKDKEDKIYPEFADWEKSSEYTRPALKWAVATGFLSGYPDQTLNPLSYLTEKEKEILFERLSYIQRSQSYIDCLKIRF